MAKELKGRVSFDETGGRKDLQDIKLTFKSRGEHDHDVPLVLESRKRRGNLQPQEFVSLHHHSTFSYLDGYQLPEAHARRIADLNMSAFALTEHGNVSSHVKMEKACDKIGVKPIFGVELYCGEIGEETRTRRKNHLTILAKDIDGYRNVLRLVSRSYSEGFYFEPTADGQMLADHKDGLIVLSGCQGSLLFTSLMGGKNIAPEDASYLRARSVARRFKKTFDSNYYIEVQGFPELEQTCRANPMLAKIAEELHIPLVATMDVHYTDVSEREMQMILHNVRPGEKRTLEEMARAWGYEAALAPPASDKAIYRRLRRTGLTHPQAVQAVLNTRSIAEDCNVRLPQLPLIRYESQNGKTSQEEWTEAITEGWHFRRFDQLPREKRQEAKAKLKHERRIIESKDYVDYFLIVSDAVKWAKDNGVAVGPARGSAAASLICYLLRITEVNPLDFPNLVFERFIDITREDLPDIDLDFDAEERYKVRDYLVSRYGAECVTNIGTFSTYKAKLALDDVARVFKIPWGPVESVKELLIERSSGDLRASATIEDTIDYFEIARDVFEQHPHLHRATALEGNVKGFGVHAAGLVVSNGPITEVASVVQRVIKGEPITVVAMDKYDAERQGLLKLDFLGLNTVSLVAEAARTSGMEMQDMYDLPLDDPKVIDMFRRNDVTGIFQFEGRAVRSVCGAIAPDDFGELCDILALARPGPLHNGASDEYIDIKKGRRKPEVMHPILEDITSPTKYQVVYQEQILRIVREIGEFSWTHAAYIRKIISHKLGDAEFNRQWGTFLKGARKNGLTDKEAKAIWGLCITSGSYAFNYAHCTAYGMLSYWAGYFKTYHPANFYAAALSKMNRYIGSGNARFDRHAALLRDAQKHGIEIKPPTVRSSRRTWWAPSKTRLRAGFEQIPGVGTKMATSFVDGINSHDWDRWDQLAALRGVGPKTVEKLKLFSHSTDPFGLDRLPGILRRARAYIWEQQWLPSPTHTADTIPYEKGDALRIVWLGVIIHRNLRDIFEVNRKRTGVELNPEDIKRPDLNEWVVMLGDDGTEQVSLYINRYRYPQFKKDIWELRLNTDPVIIMGSKPSWQHSRAIMVDRMIPLKLGDL